MTRSTKQMVGQLTSRLRKQPAIGQRLVHGVTAGAVGTAALNLITYLDMAIRARPSSSVPAQTVDRITDLVGVSEASEGHDSDQAKNRRQAFGSLLGYATGFGVGAVYGLLRPGPLRGLPRPLAAIAAGGAATAATVIPYRALGVSDPLDWPAKSWAADIIPHLGYGWATAAAFDALHSHR
jgi:hypothetical protein